MGAVVGRSRQPEQPKHLGSPLRRDLPAEVVESPFAALLDLRTAARVVTGCCSRTDTIIGHGRRNSQETTDKNCAPMMETETDKYPRTFELAEGGNSSSDSSSALTGNATD